MKATNVCVVTGTRAEYGALRPVIQAIQETPQLRLQVCVTGMHLLSRFGKTAKLIEQDGWGEIFRVPMQAQRDSQLQQALGLARGVAGMAKEFAARDTDVVVILGDRIEALAGGLAGAISGRAVAHIHGGEVATGQQDDAIRHALSKLAHLHLVATTEAAERLVRMGEPKWRIKRVGAPSLDVLYRTSVPDETWLRERFGMPGLGEFIIVAQHPVGPDADIERRRMQQTLGAVTDVGLPVLIIYPNSDSGHSGIVQAIRSRPKLLRAKVFRSLTHEDFLKVLLAAAAIVGNSSAGIIEAPAAGTPSVNIGSRQAGRLRNGRSIIECGYREQSIAAATRRAVALKRRFRPFRKTAYGDGRAAQRIVKALVGLRITDRLLRKQNRY